MYLSKDRPSVFDFIVEAGEGDLIPQPLPPVPDLGLNGRCVGHFFVKGQGTKQVDLGPVWIRSTFSFSRFSESCSASTTATNSQKRDF